MKWFFNLCVWNCVCIRIVIWFSDVFFCFSCLILLLMWCVFLGLFQMLMMCIFLFVLSLVYRFLFSCLLLLVIRFEVVVRMCGVEWQFCFSWIILVLGKFFLNCRMLVIFVLCYEQIDWLLLFIMQMLWWFCVSSCSYRYWIWLVFWYLLIMMYLKCW